MMENSVRDISLTWNLSSTTSPKWKYDDIIGESGKLSISPIELFIQLNSTTVTLCVLYSLTFLVGIIGNILVVIVFTQHKRMRSVTNIFLVNLAVADLSVLTVCMPVTIGSYVYQDWIYGDFLCKLTPFLQATAVCVSVLSLLVISLNRYYGIHKPIKAKIMFSRNKVLIAVGLIWIVASLACCPLLFVNKLQSYGVPGLIVSRMCSEKWTGGLAGKQLFNVFVFLVMFAVPVLLMSLAYLRISVHLWRGDDLLRRRGSEVLKEQQARVLRQRRQTVKMLIVLVFLFTISWLPYHVVNLWLDYNMSSLAVKVVITKVYPFVQWFGFTNSAMNPMCYGFLSVKFRKALRGMCFSQRARRSPLVSSQHYSATSETLLNRTITNHGQSKLQYV